jgi:transposase
VLALLLENHPHRALAHLGRKRRNSLLRHDLSYSRWEVSGIPGAVHTDDRAEVGRLAEAVQEATGDSVDIAFVDQGYTGTKPAAAAQAHGMELEVVKLSEAKRGFVLLPRRWVVERSFAWATRCRRLVKDYERYASTLVGLHIAAFTCLMLKRAAILAAGS